VKLLLTHAEQTLEYKHSSDSRYARIIQNPEMIAEKPE
jgi:hypothetical protein